VGNCGDRVRCALQGLVIGGSEGNAKYASSGSVLRLLPDHVPDVAWPNECAIIVYGRRRRYAWCRELKREWDGRNVATFVAQGIGGRVFDSNGAGLSFFYASSAAGWACAARYKDSLLLNQRGGGMCG
jgi:hypothetical protein